LSGCNRNALLTTQSVRCRRDERNCFVTSSGRPSSSRCLRRRVVLQGDRSIYWEAEMSGEKLGDTKDVRFLDHCDGIRV